jgi:hypothetical protein
MQLIACPECIEITGTIDPMCPVCGGHGQIGVPDLDEDTVYEEFIEGYELRPAFREFVAMVHTIVGPLLSARGYAPTADRAPDHPEPSFSKPWRNLRYPAQQWHLMINYQYAERTEVFDYREFSINVFRSPVEKPYVQYALVPGGLNSRVSYTDLLWIPEHLQDMTWGYTPIGADPPTRTRFPTPQSSWYYRTTEELQHVLTVGANFLPVYLDWLGNPAAARSPNV